MNSTKQYFASFMMKPLEYEIFFYLAAVSDNLKILHISAVFIFGQYQYTAQEIFIFFPNFISNLIAWFVFRAFGPSHMRDSTDKEQLFG